MDSTKTLVTCYSVRDNLTDYEYQRWRPDIVQANRNAMLDMGITRDVVHTFTWTQRLDDGKLMFRLYNFYQPEGVNWVPPPIDDERFVLVHAERNAEEEAEPDVEEAVAAANAQPQTQESSPVVMGIWVESSDSSSGSSMSQEADDLTNNVRDIVQQQGEAAAQTQTGPVAADPVPPGATNLFHDAMLRINEADLCNDLLIRLRSTFTGPDDDDLLNDEFEQEEYQCNDFGPLDD